MSSLRLLNIGAGGAPLLDWIPGDYQEIRVDLSVDSRPDVVADMRDLPFEDEYADAVACLSSLEHVSETEVPIVLREFHRVLKPDGKLYLHVPDLKAVARHVLYHGLTGTFYDSPSGPIRALDVIYGYQAGSHLLMRHLTGFTGQSLADALAAAGFSGEVQEAEPCELMASTRKRLGVCNVTRAPR